MSEKSFLKQLSENKIIWTGDAIKKAKNLEKKGYTEYKSAWYAGWWEITEAGKKFAGV